jgi:hypothetical protein
LKAVANEVGAGGVTYVAAISTAGAAATWTFFPFSAENPGDSRKDRDKKCT